MNFQYISSEEKVTFLNSVRDNVKPILATNLMPHFTDHSVEHSDRIVGYVDNLIKPIMETENKLSEEELTILYSACYLHDIGMQL